MCIINVGNRQKDSNAHGDIDTQFLTQNVRGLNNSLKRNKIFNNFKKKADIIFVQESHSTREVEDRWRSMWGGKIEFSHGTSASRGCMILFKNDLELTISETKNDENGRYIFVKCIIQGQKFLLINVYGPNKEQEHKQFLTELYADACDFYEDDYYHIIVGGDWNFIENLDMDKKGGVQKLWENSIIQINKLKERFDLTDVWRVKNENLKQYTWHSNSTPRVFTRLDRFYISDNLLSITKKSSKIPGLCSDHSGVIFQIKSNASSTGPGLWKLNTSLLKDLQFVNSLNGTIDEVKGMTDFTDKRSHWDYLKYKVKECAIRESKIRAKIKREETALLEKKILDADKLLSENPASQQAAEIKKEAEKALDVFHEEKTKALIVQSRCQYYEEGEKNSKFFLGMLKSNQEKTLIRTLKTEEGTIENQKSILNEIQSFYSELYTRRPTLNPSEWIDSIERDGDIPKINDRHMDKFTEELTAASLAKIIKTCPKNKSPGNDGLPTEFYIVFWHKISELLVDTYRECIVEEEMSTSQKQSVIRLIPKKDRDKLLLKNWRPLNLINSDTKYYTKWTANKLLPALGDIIHPNQVAYVKGRFIGEGIKTIEGVIHFIRENKLDGYILAIDFEKAFDSIEWDYLWESLETFGFPSAYIKLIKVAYKNMEACVINGGSTTNFFKLTRGVRQGDPISAYLFIIALELIAIKIRQNKKIKCITINGTEIKLSVYADDMTLFPLDIASALEIFKELDFFSKISGLRCNQEKTEAMRLGKSNMDHDNGIIVKWVDYLTVTGITFSETGISAGKNLEGLPEKIECELQKWKARHLSLLGRCQIIKTFGYSQIRFLSNMMILPKEVSKEIQTKAYNFLWNGSERGKVKRNAIMGDIERGGIRFPDLMCIVKSQHIVWVKRFLHSPYHPWKEIFIWQIEKLGGKHILENTSMDIKCIDGFKLMIFYKNLLINWAEYNTVELTSDNILNQQLFLNKYIKRPNSQSIYYPNLIKKGIIRVKDIINERNLIQAADVIKQTNGLTTIEFMQYISIVHCLTSDFKEIISNAKHPEVNQETPYMMTEKTLKTITSKRIYNSILSKQVCRPTSEAKLNEILNMQCNDQDWENIYKLPFLSTIESKLRSFQFKINHNIYYTNEKLKQVRKADTDLCSFCNEEKETLLHLFVDCRHIKDLWIFSNDLIQRTSSIPALTDQQKILGIPEIVNSSQFDVVNHIAIVVKHFIHICKHKNQEPSVPRLKERIIDIERLERMIAIRKNKFDLHNKKWSNILNELRTGVA